MKRILVVLSEWGYWGEELVGPLYHFDKAGYEVSFVTPKGKKPEALPPSMDPDYTDPPLGRFVTTPENATRARELANSTRLDSPINLSVWFPERPYLSDPNYLEKLENYHRALERVNEDIKGYDCLLLVGGSGPIIDIVNNQRIHDLILGFVNLGKWVAAECYGVACLAFARDWETRKSIIWGKHVTGHPLEYDYKDGTGFIGTDINIGPPPYPLEFVLRDAVGPSGRFHGNVGKRTSVVVDYPFITSRSTASSYLCGELITRVLSAGKEQADDWRKNWCVY